MTMEVAVMRALAEAVTERVDVASRGELVSMLRQLRLIKRQLLGGTDRPMLTLIKGGE
jgi:hypothetical protein